jgi:hypothetical protein
MSPPIAARLRKARKNALCLRYTKDPHDPKALDGAAYALADYGDELNKSLVEQWKQMVKAKNDDAVVVAWSNRLATTVKYIEGQAHAGTILLLKGAQLGLSGVYERYRVDHAETFAKVNGGTVKQSEIVAQIAYSAKNSVDDILNAVIAAIDHLDDPGTDF